MIRTQRSHLNVDAHTHPGMTGKNNEDRYGVASFIVSQQDKTPVLFAVLSDGIGGHRGGEVAAELAVNHIMQAVARTDGNFSRHIIEDAVSEASDAIASHSASNEEIKGMGATCVIAWIIGDKLHTAYVGDSRIYLLRGGRIQQVTIDHSWVQEAIEKGLITPEMGHDHPNVHVIRRYLGSPVPPDPDFRLNLFDGEGAHHAENNQGTRLEPNDILLLCTDGLTDLVWNDEILEIVRSKSNLKEASRMLIDLANQRGGHDNITVVLIGVPADIGKMESKKGRGWVFWVMVAVMGLIAFLIVASLLIFGLFLRKGTVTPVPAVSLTPLAQTQMPESIATTVPTETITPEVISSPEPTLTPWPTNTIAP